MSDPTRAAAFLDRDHPAGDAICELFARLKQLQGAGHDWPGADVVDLLTRWLGDVGIDPARGVDQLPPTPAAPDPGEVATRHRPTTALRVAWATAALDTYDRRTQPVPPAARDALVTRCADLIADVLHLAARDTGVARQILTVAMGYYVAEHTPVAGAGGRSSSAVSGVADDRGLDLDRVAALVTEAGVDCVLGNSGGGVATIWAGPRRFEPGWGFRFAALAGPGSFGWGRGPSTASLADFHVGPDDDGEADPLDVASVDARTEEHIAALIVAQACLADPLRTLDPDTARQAIARLTTAPGPLRPT